MGEQTTNLSCSKSDIYANAGIHNSDHMIECDAHTHAYDVRLQESHVTRTSDISPESMISGH
jgi:hypothetical protein